jgi:coenzyme PQQ precursor peptide PqqA
LPSDLSGIKTRPRGVRRERVFLFLGLPVPGLAPGCPYRPNGESAMSKWIKPAYTDLRLGFEITMYISNR